MSVEQPKTAPTTNTDQYPPPTVAYPHNFNGATYPPPGPPGAYPQPFYSPYPPPSDGAHPENGQNGTPSTAPYMMFHAPPPGVFLAYPPPPSQGQGYAVPQSPQNPATRPKRKQVKMACTNCAAACKRCDERRPCERCMKYGIAESCVDGQRKERKKGIKRGPYKRKNKNGTEPSFTESPTEGGWATAASPAAQNPSTPVPGAAQGVPPFPPNPGEGYYPYFFPHPGGFIPHPHEGQPGQEGTPPHNNGQPPIMPYYIHPSGYAAYPPPYPIYPPQGALPPHMAQAQSQPAQSPESVDAAKKATTTMNGNDMNGAAGAEATKKTRLAKSGEPKAKKSKNLNGAKSDKGTTGNEGTNAISI